MLSPPLKSGTIESGSERNDFETMKSNDNSNTIGKKIKVVQDVISQLGLKNVKAEQKRAENVKKIRFDFIVSRAVTNLPDFISWVQHNISKKQKNKLRNGILYIKGGDVLEEIAYTDKKYKIFELSQIFEEEFFETKKVIHLY